MVHFFCEIQFIKRSSSVTASDNCSRLQLCEMLCNFNCAFCKLLYFENSERSVPDSCLRLAKDFLVNLNCLVAYVNADVVASDFVNRHIPHFGAFLNLA